MEKQKPTPRLPSEPSAPPPSPSSNLVKSSSLFRDISNYKTPKPHCKSSYLNPPPSPAVYFTALRRTPSSAAAAGSTIRSRSRAPSSHSKAAGRLRALEIEQSKSSRKVQIRREKALKSFAGAATAWLNFLFENPGACGCDSSGRVGGCRREDAGSARRGKRPSLDGGAAFGISRAMRSPKRRRSSQLRAGDVGEATKKTISASALAMLEVSLRDVCSLEDLRERMGPHLSQEGCDEVLFMMSRVTKCIDDGKLKMKAHCPIMTDVGLKKKALGILLSYNPWWLCIGLNVIFGGDSLLADDKSMNATFLKMVCNRLLLSHGELAKAYSYNRLVEGVYRPGYYEALGGVILKRFLLLVLFLDKAKSESFIPLKYGIDGIDGGSHLLFCRQNHIKSSRQLIHEFLADAMHGEGDLYAHLVMLGYKVTHEQSPLAEYHFHISNIFDDFQDGVLLCRAMQLLQHDASFLLKVVVPSDTQKKCLQNCRLVLQSLEQVNVPLKDKDGTLILPEDITNGDQELVLSLIWNIFIHLQLPLLLDRTLLLAEIAKVQGSADIDNFKYKDKSCVCLLFEWIQAVCEAHQIKVDTCSSMVDAKALCCVVDYYLKNGFLQCSQKEKKCISVGESSTDLISSNYEIVQDLLLIQRVTTMFGNFPEVLPINDVLGESLYDDRCLMILLTFFASVLLNHKDQIDVGELVKCAQLPQTNATTPSLAYSGRQIHSHPRNRSLLFDSPFKQDKLDTTKERAACTLQLHLRGHVLRQKFLKIKAAVALLQNVTRLWLSFSRKHSSQSLNNASECFIYQGYLRYMTDRHRFLGTKKAVRLIQKAVREWIKCNQSKNVQTFGPISSPIMASSAPLLPFVCSDNTNFACDLMSSSQNLQVSIEDMLHLKVELEAAKKLQRSWRQFLFKKSAQRTVSAVVIQTFWRSLTARRKFMAQREAASKIQCCYYSQRLKEAFSMQKEAATVIQQIIRGQVARHRLLGSSTLQPSARTYTKCKNVELKKVLHSILTLQRWWRQILINRLWSKSLIIIQAYIRQQNAHREFCDKLCSICIIQRWWRRTLFLQVRKASAITIQACFRSWVARRQVNQQRNDIVLIQRWWRKTLVLQVRKASAVTIQACFRGWLDRKQVIQERKDIVLIQAYLRQQNAQREFCNKLCSIHSIQRWWRRTLFIQVRKASAVTIQACFRGWLARRQVNQERKDIILIQSYWKGCLVRRSSKPQISHIRCKIKKASTDVNDDMRLINRLLFALSELLDDKKISNIRQTCATLNMATEHSQICREKLVSAGALSILCTKIHLLNRGVPDQEVLKHILSTLRNIARYAHLASDLIDTPQSVQTIFNEVLRNKGEGYFIACEILTNLMKAAEGPNAICCLHSHIKRLGVLVQDLDTKLEKQKRFTHLDYATRGNTEQRSRAASNLFKLIIGRL